jgi:hypothetical protein
MNVLYLGHYREQSGFGYSSKRIAHALSLDEKVNLSIRSIYLQTDFLDRGIDPKLLELEKNKSDRYHCVIQDTLPDFYEYNSGFGKNIAIVRIATRHLSHTGWIEKINMMDEIWVGSFFVEKVLRESGVHRKIKVTPEPFNITTIENQIAPKQDDEFYFYSMSSFDAKDNLLGLLIAYLSEFSINDNARLIIKLDNNNEQMIKNTINNAYEISRKNKNNTKEPIFILGHIDEHKKNELHNNADCYVDVSFCSYNAASCIEAMLYNNVCICTEKTANACFVTVNNGLNVKSVESEVISNHMYGSSNVFTINETWRKPDLIDIKNKMRQAYDLNQEEKTYKLHHIDKSIFDANNFSRYLK